MQRIPNTTLTPKELKLLMERSPFNQGGEAVLYISPSNSVYKLFIDPDATGFELTGMSDNKFQKISRLYQMNVKYSSQIISTISCEGKLIGYETVKEKNHLPLFLLSRKQKIDFLMQAKNALEYFHGMNIIYGDVKTNNILLHHDTKSVMFGDMDNICLENYPIDMQSTTLQDFILFHGNVDASCDAYMHNLMTLQSLNYYGTTYDDVERKLMSGTYPKGYLEPAKEIIDSMRKPADFNGKYLIQYVKK